MIIRISLKYQEAHEAIRPSNIELNDLAKENDPNFEGADIKLYNLIWRRTVASQMSNAKIENQSIFKNCSKRRKY